ncbi:MAG: YggS family pyridoxal phosphate-dependent enzyme [Oscillospiraceae bacterium]|nr:YggS family pyridoxal phosphate-dependent enzyme [Oscillospiraceae bacterium]
MSEQERFREIEDAMKIRLDAFRKAVRDEMDRAGRNSDELTIIGVSKFFPVGYARAAVRLGLLDLGENRVVELLEKRETLEAEGLSPNWHLIGTLQTNKVKRIIGKTALIHSVDSIHLLDEISSRSEAAGMVTKILLQVNVSDEDSKHGFSTEDAESAVRHANDCPGISLNGFMTMAPIIPCSYTPRMVFEGLRELFDRMKPVVRDPGTWTILSMGMSQDYVDAIHSGATHIRIGTSIFGPRTV